MPRLCPIFSADPVEASVVEWEDLPSLRELVVPRVAPMVVQPEVLRGLTVIEHFDLPALPPATSGFADTVPAAL